MIVSIRRGESYFFPLSCVHSKLRPLGVILEANVSQKKDAETGNLL